MDALSSEPLEVLRQTLIVDYITYYAALPDCRTPSIALAVAKVASTAGNGFLFLIRVRAVYEGSKIITLGFGLWWLAVIGTTILYLFGAHMEHEPHSSQCLITSAESWATASLIGSYAIHPPVHAAYDNSNSTPKHANVGVIWSAFLCGNGLPRMCRELLRGGQLFYFVTIGFTLLASCMSLAPVTPILRVGLMPPVLAVSTIMTCWVFRDITLAACLEECPEESVLQALNGARTPMFTSVGVVSRVETEAKTQTSGTRV
ncbi:hypothetical protein HWV62_5440 [Athelia sp. TMB]|nr:hypothetical protein HWV62_5440 [Athelia sp. TMB]